MSEEVKETMEDFASELEASYKEFDERRNPYQEQEGPDAEKWAELVQQMQDKAVLNVKVKEAVKGGLVTYVNDIQGFIPASQISTKYVEKLEDMVGQHLEVTPITVVPENKKLVLSGRAVMKQKEEEEKAAKMAAVEVGALCGEAVVFPKNNAPKHFMTIIKQHGALLAKGRLLGVQFDTLFTDDLYLTISKNAIKTANTLKEALKEKGYTFYIDSPTNQIFLVLEDERLKQLEKEATVSFWEKADDNHTIIRLATSWATKEEEIKALIEIL